MSTKVRTAEDVVRRLARKSPVWGDSIRCAGMCWHASNTLAVTLDSQGFTEVALVQADGWIGNHYAVQVDDMVYDLTFRQFEPDGPFPLIETFVEWSIRMDGYIGEPTITREYL